MSSQQATGLQDIEVDTKYSRSDLMTDGRVDPAKVREIQSPGSGDVPDAVDASECAEIREVMSGVEASEEAADEVGRADSTVRRHINGNCGHDVDQPAFEFDATAEEWVMQDE